MLTVPGGAPILFNSFPFLAFFAAVVVAYYALPVRLRWAVLLVASTGFYGTLNPGYVLLLAVAALVAYGAGLGLATVAEARRRRLVLGASIVAELGALFVFKYYDFFATSFHALQRGLGLTTLEAPPGLLNLLIPAGLSFYSFSCVSYLADVYRGQVRPERNLGQLALYVAFFPKLIAGPIERATSFLPQVHRGIRFDPDNLTRGLQLMLWGLFKKVVIADRLAPLVDRAYQLPATSSPVELILGMYLFAFQIYCDFSGYTDIARGAARVLGFSLMENFRRPYLATSIPEFWGTRWHISLSRWFRDYLYFPLGGNRVNIPRWYLNLFLVFLVSGLWHGANWTFVIWGALNGAYQVVHVATDPVRARFVRLIRAPAWLVGLLGGLLTFHLVLVSWVFFRAASLSDATTVLSRVWQAVPNLPVLMASYPVSFDVGVAFVLIAVLMLVELFDERRAGLAWLNAQPTPVRWATAYVLLAGLLVLGNWTLSRFVYMQF